MQLYTSHWRNPDLAGLGAVKVGISRGVPRGKQAAALPYRYKRLQDLAPPRALFERWKAGTAGPEEYERVYRAHLDGLGPDRVAEQLESKSPGGEDIVLLCWCALGAFCHRRVFADWYREKAGLDVPELAELAEHRGA